MYIASGSGRGQGTKFSIVLNRKMAKYWMHSIFLGIKVLMNMNLVGTLDQKRVLGRCNVHCICKCALHLQNMYCICKCALHLQMCIISANVHWICILHCICKCTLHLQCNCSYNVTAATM
jgi:hypothetical protein